MMQGRGVNEAPAIGTFLMEKVLGFLDF